MALVRQRTEKYELAGTIINALVHHHAIDHEGMAVVTGHVLAVIEGTEEDGESTAWMKDQIARISEQLGD
jgi:hypothetical protein